MGKTAKMGARFDAACMRACSVATARARSQVQAMRRAETGQGTTEYAILVGVLVVIAILAIMIFRPKLQELWNAIAEGINGL